MSFSDGLDKKAKDFRKWTGTDKICQVAANLLGSTPANKRQMLESFRQWGQDRSETSADAQYANNFVFAHLTTADLAEMDFLFAMGVQIAANALGDYRPRDVGVGGGEGTGEFGAMYDTGNDRLVTATPNGIRFYVLKKYADQLRDEYKHEFLATKGTLFRDMVETGVEEYCHLTQMKNPQKRAQMEKELIERYGSPWDERRNQAIAEAQRTNTLKQFYENDPLEKDAHAFIKTVKGKIDQAAAQYRKKQNNRGVG